MKNNLWKKIGVLSLTGLLVSSGIGSSVYAATAKAKEEVVYINLNNDGSTDEIYVVNILPGGGSVEDYGDYSKVRNMNTVDVIEQAGDKITTSTNVEKLYYEGYLEAHEIPWNINISYMIDDKEYNASELAGKSGNFKMKLSITVNENSKKEFYNNYALQIAFNLDTKKFKNIESEGATIVNVGNEKQLSYIILPGSEKEITVEAVTNDFEMKPININGMKMSLDVDVETLFEGNMNDKVKELQTETVRLDDGVTELSDGTIELKEGAGSLTEGVTKLQDGLKQMDDGLRTLNQQSGELKDGSGQISKALSGLEKALSKTGSQGKDVQKLVKASEQIQSGIRNMEASLGELDSNVNYKQFSKFLLNNNLDINNIVTKNDETANQLSKMAEAMSEILTSEQAELLNGTAQLLKANSGMAEATKQYMNGVSSNISKLSIGAQELTKSYDQFHNAITELSNGLTAMTQSMESLKSGIQTLNTQYKKLDGGIGSYTDGINKLVKGCNEAVSGIDELKSGCNELNGGTNDLFRGVTELKEGTGKFVEETSDLEEQVKDTISEELDSRLGKNSEVISFVSDKNKEVKSVQFVIKTPSIEKEEMKQIVEQTEEKSSFGEKLSGLFKR